MCVRCKRQSHMHAPTPPPLGSARPAGQARHPQPHSAQPGAVQRGLEDNQQHSAGSPAFSRWAGIVLCSSQQRSSLTTAPSCSFCTLHETSTSAQPSSGPAVLQDHARRTVRRRNQLLVPDKGGRSRGSAARAAGALRVLRAEDDQDRRAGKLPPYFHPVCCMCSMMQFACKQAASCWPDACTQLTPTVDCSLTR